MPRILLLSFFVFALMQFANGQTAPDTTIVAQADSIPATNTVAEPADPVQEPVYSSDSVSEKPWYYTNWEVDTSVPLAIQAFKYHPYYGFGSNPLVVYNAIKKFTGKEITFYVLVALLLAFAFLRQAFPKYFNDLFRLLFRTTLKQKQVREQLMQTPLPSLLLNGFFVVSAGLYIDILLQHFKLAPVDNFWLLFVYCALGLMVIYTAKFIGLKISGWIFNMKEGADTYIFIVFIINKVIGVFLLPFLILLSFMQGTAFTIALVLSWCGIGVLLISRFLLTYSAVRNQVRFNPFHFFLYLCAFEIAPLLLIYKALLFFFR